MHLVILGLGYSGRAIAAAARDAGYEVTGTHRADPGPPAAGATRVVAFDDAAGAIATATHLIASVPPGEQGDPALARFRGAIEAAPALGWIGYLSTTGVYGDRQGGWVDEASTPDPASPRAARRIEAERGWAGLTRRRYGQERGRAVDLLRLAGIYGPGRSVFDDLRAGTSRPVAAPGHAFGRIHREDIAGGALAAMATADAEAGAVRVLNFSDDEPAESAAVIAEAARLLGVAPPTARPLAEAWAEMSPMARSFWADNRRVSSRLTQEVLGRRWRFPTYREGLVEVLRVDQLVGHRGEDEQVRLA